MLTACVQMPVPLLAPCGDTACWHSRCGVVASGGVPRFWVESESPESLQMESTGLSAEGAYVSAQEAVGSGHIPP